MSCSSYKCYSVSLSGLVLHSALLSFVSTGLSVCLIVPVMTAPFMKPCPVLLQHLRYVLIVNKTGDEREAFKTLF